MGATTPLGGDVASTWDGAPGRSQRRLAPSTSEWVEHVRPAGEDRRAARGGAHRDPQARRGPAARPLRAGRDRRGPRGLGARGPRRYPATEGGSPKVDGLRLAVIIGTGIGGALTLLGQDDILEQQGLRKVSPLTIPMLMPNGPAAHVGLEFGAAAGVHAPVSACASGAEALAWALADAQGRRGRRRRRRRRRGLHRRRSPIAGFVPGAHAWRSATTSPSGPRGRSTPTATASCSARAPGIIVLEREEFAQARGATVHGRLAGIGTSADAYHITAPDPEGSGPVPGHRGRPADARVSTRPTSGHVNCHATVHLGGRRGRDGGGQEGDRRPPGAHRAEGLAGSPARCRRRGREHHDDAVGARGPHPAHARTSRSSTPASRSTSWRASRARSRSTPRSATRSASAGTTSAWRSPCLI